MKEDIKSYLTIAGAFAMIFPLIHAFFALDFGLIKGGVIAFCIYTAMMLLAIPMYNYLQYGKFWYWVKNKNNL